MGRQKEVEKESKEGGGIYGGLSAGGRGDPRLAAKQNKTKQK
jgi:hypothetical protein